MKFGANERLTLATGAESLEALSRRGLLLRVELEDEVADLRVTSSHR